jgi:hypothetical protein
MHAKSDNLCKYFKHSRIPFVNTILVPSVELNKCKLVIGESFLLKLISESFMFRKSYSSISPFRCQETGDWGEQKSI